MNRPLLNRAVARLIKARTVIVTPRQVIVSVKNGADFPKLADNVAARVMMQDIDPNVVGYNSRASFEVMK